MTARLASGLWVQAYLTRLQQEGLPCYVVARGDGTAGAILVKLCTLDGQAKAYQRIMTADGARRWDVTAQGAEMDVEQVIKRARGSDPDLWVIEVESRMGRHLLDEAGFE